MFPSKLTSENELYSKKLSIEPLIVDISAALWEIWPNFERDINGFLKKLKADSERFRDFQLRFFAVLPSLLWNIIKNPHKLD